jgi:hypothetical protein
MPEVRATYRLQLHRGFDLYRACESVASRRSTRSPTGSASPCALAVVEAPRLLAGLLRPLLQQRKASQCI